MTAELQALLYLPCMGSQSHMIFAKLWESGYRAFTALIMTSLQHAIELILSMCWSWCKEAGCLDECLDQSSSQVPWHVTKLAPAASAGLNLLLEMLQSFQHSDFATQFHKTYYLTLMQEIFAVMTGQEVDVADCLPCPSCTASYAIASQ